MSRSTISIVGIALIVSLSACAADRSRQVPDFIPKRTEYDGRQVQLIGAYRRHQVGAKYLFSSTHDALAWNYSNSIDLGFADLQDSIAVSEELGPGPVCVEVIGLYEYLTEDVVLTGYQTGRNGIVDVSQIHVVADDNCA